MERNTNSPNKESSTINMKLKENNKTSLNHIFSTIDKIERKKSSSPIKPKSKFSLDSNHNSLHPIKHISDISLVEPKNNKTYDCIIHNDKIDETVDKNNHNDSVYDKIQPDNYKPAVLVLKDHPDIKRESSSSLVNTCRVCYDPNNEEKGKLISPCQCQGSVQYIHESCLKKWIENNIINNDRKIRPECELCKYKYIMKFTSEFKFSKIKFWNMMKSLAAMVIVATIILTLIFTVIYVVVTSLGNLTDIGKNNLINILISVAAIIMLILILMSFKNWRLNYYDRLIKDWKIYNIDGKHC